MRIHRFVPVVIAAASLIGAAPVMARVSAAKAAPSITVHSSNYGKILFDGRTRALYAFTKDAKGGPSTCYGGCATAWPPYIVTARPRATSGVRQAHLGTVRRRDGKLQATYAGRPLYYYVGDRSPGQVLCQNVDEFGGLWLVLRSSGALVR